MDFFFGCSFFFENAEIYIIFANQIVDFRFKKYYCTSLESLGWQHISKNLFVYKLFALHFGAIKMDIHLLWYGVYSFLPSIGPFCRCCCFCLGDQEKDMNFSGDGRLA